MKTPAAPAIAAPAVLSRSARALAFLGAFALAITGEIQPAFLAAFLAFYAIGLRVERMPRLSRLTAAAEPWFALMVLALAVTDFFLLSNSFLLSVAHFLLGVQAARLLVLKTTRENLGSVLLSSLMMLSASTLAVDWSFFLALAIFLPFVIWTLALYNIAVEGAEGGAAVAQAGSPLWETMSPYLRLSAGVAFAVTAAWCAFVFVVFPRFNFQGFRGQFLQPVHRTGFTSQVDLNKSGRIFLDNSVVMRVQIDPEDRPYWPGYLRGSTMDSFDGRIWNRTGGQMQRVFRTGRGEITLPLAGRPAGRRLKQSIYLESTDSPVLFAAPQAALMRIDRMALLVAQDGSVQRSTGDTWRVHYEVESLVPDGGRTSGRDMRRGRAGPAQGRFVPSMEQAPRRPSEWRDASSAPVSPRIRGLARQVVTGARTEREAAERIAAYLRENHTYSLSLPSAQKGKDPVERFLFETKSGHCEYFASAMCLMLQSVDIPARMAAGFLAVEWNERGSYFVVRMRDAHAWVEVYLAPAGWTPFDPSPRADATGAPDWRQRAAELADYLNLRWNRYILSYDIQRQLDIVRAVAQGGQAVTGRLDGLADRVRALLDPGAWRDLFKRREGGASQPAGVPRGLVLAVAGVAIFVAAAAWWRHRRRPGAWFHRRLVAALARAGVDTGPARTMGEMTADAAYRAPGHAADWLFLRDAYHRRRFGPAAGWGPADDRAVKERLSALTRPTEKQETLAMTR